MKKLKFIPLFMLSVMLLASCQSRESKIEKLVTSHLEQSLENPQNLKGESPELEGVGDSTARLSLWPELLYQAGAGLHDENHY